MHLPLRGALAPLTVPRAVSAGGGGSPLLDGLAAYWKLDEANGSRADSVGSATLTQEGVPIGTPGKISNGVNLVAASSQSLYRLNEALFNPMAGQKIGIAAWVNLASAPATGRIVAKTAGGEFQFSLAYSSGRFRFTVNNGLFEANDGGAGVSLSTWYFVAGWTTGDDVKLRVNATTYSRFDTLGDHFAADIDSGTGPLRIGARNPVAVEHFDGIIDEVGLWISATDPFDGTKLDTLYNSGAGRTHPFS